MLDAREEGRRGVGLGTGMLVEPPRDLRPAAVGVAPMEVRGFAARGVVFWGLPLDEASIGLRVGVEGACTASASCL